MIRTDSRVLNPEQRRMKWLALLPCIAAFATVLAIGAWLVAEAFQKQSRDAVTLAAGMLGISLSAVELGVILLRKGDWQVKLEKVSATCATLFPAWMGILMLLTVLSGRL